MNLHTQKSQPHILLQTFNKIKNSPTKNPPTPILPIDSPTTNKQNKPKKFFAEITQKFLLEKNQKKIPKLREIP